MNYCVYMVKNLGVQPWSFLGIVNVDVLFCCVLLILICSLKSAENEPRYSNSSCAEVSDTGVALLLHCPGLVESPADKLVSFFNAFVCS